jgi:hypothetical protein
MYKVYNGSEWVDICDCNLNVYGHNNQWVNVDPRACEVRFWNGTEWCLVNCSQQCLDFLLAGECRSIPSSIGFNGAFCSSLFPGQDCEQLVAYIPIKLTDQNLGFTVEFSPFSVYDGLDVVDICNENVLGGLGMLGRNQFPNDLPRHRISPGTYTYNKKVFYNFTTNQFEVLGSFADFQMTFKYPQNCINDWDTTQTVGITTGYENLLSQGDPIPAINEMYLPLIYTNETSSGTNTCPVPLNNAERVDYVFNRPAPPPGGYPPEETVLLRVFGSPLRETLFEVNNITCF